MTRNQQHGKRFEDQIKGCGLFSGSADSGRSPTSGFDIEARFDRTGRSLATSIKTTGSDVVALSDARRFFREREAFRMLVGQYRQDGEIKTFFEVHECILPAEALAELRGELDATEVEEFHQGLLLASFPLGQHVEARAWANLRNRELGSRRTRIVLNPKIGSDTQRRLQCSVRLADLIEVAKRLGEYELHDKAIGHTLLPIRQISPPRQFKQRT